MKKISRRNFLKGSGAMAAAGALAACGGSGASTPAASGAASTSTAASAAAAGLQHLLSSMRIPLIKTGSAPLRGAVCFLYANRRDRCIWPTDMVH